MRCIPLFLNKGRGIGSFVGGTLIAKYGTRATFQILGTR